MSRRFIPEPPIFTFRVRLPGYRDEDGTKVEDVWRAIEIAANQTLEELGELIPLAFDFDDPHMWSFFLSGKAWDQTTEYALSSEPGIFDDAEPRAAGDILIRDVPLPGTSGKKEFLFLFDYGDEWHFRVKFMGRSDTVEPGAAYPRVVAQQGEAPPQYEGLDEEDGEGE